MRDQKTWVWGLVAIAIVGGLVWLGTRSSPVPGNQEPVKIGGAFALSGFAAEWGEADRNGAQLAIDETNAEGGINGQQIELIVEDIASDGTKTVSAVQKLINIDNADFIVGPTWLDSYTGAAPLADEYQIVMVTPSASITAVQAEQVNDFVFSTWFRSDQETKDLAKYLAEEGLTRVALLFGNDPFWQDTAQIIRDSAPASGIEVAQDYKVNSNDVDFRTPLAQLAATDPDVIVFGFNNENQFATFLKQRQEIYPESQLVTTEYVEEFALDDSYQPLLIGTRFVAPEVAESNFAAKYRERFGKDPVFGASNAYDATNIIIDALNVGNQPGIETRDYLRNNTFSTVTFGETGFDNIGGVQSSSFVIKEITSEGIKELTQL